MACSEGKNPTQQLESEVGAPCPPDWFVQNMSAEPDKKPRRRPSTQWPSALKRPALEWLDVQALCSYACVSPNTIREWIYAPVDSLPAAQVNGKLLVRKSDFDAYLDKHKVRPLATVNIDAVVKNVLEGVEDGG